MATLYAELLDAGVMPWQVKHLTNAQIEEIIRHERDKDGRLVTHTTDAPDPKETFYAVLRSKGLPDWRIDLKWAEYQKRREEKERKVRRGL